MEEAKEWITVNGKHIPLNESGEPITETGKKTLGKETDTSEAAKHEAETAQAEPQTAQTEPQEKNNEPDAEKAAEQTGKQENEAERKDESEPETGNTVTKSDGLTYSKTLAQYREEFKDEPKGDMKAAQKFFREQLRGKRVLCETKDGAKLVFFNDSSWNKLRNQINIKALKAELVPLIPDIITSGSYRPNPLYKERKDNIVLFHEYRKIVRTSDGDRDVIVDVGEYSGKKPRLGVYSATQQGSRNYQARLEHRNNKNASGALMSRQNAAGPEASNDNVVNQIIHDATQNARGESYLEVISIRFADEPIETEAEDMPRDRPGSDVMAFDVKSSRRHKDNNGYLHVDASNITKEQVAPYYGDEIAGWRELGLEPQKLYYMYRPAEELKKAVDTFNGMPILFEHHATNADNPAKEYTIGSLGTDAEFRAPYVVNSLIITDGEAIDAIERGEYKELSAAYVYTPVMQGGIFNGEKYDGKMTDIKANHVALVKEGRAGHDVVVADSKPAKKNVAEATRRRNSDAMKRKAGQRRGALAFDAVPAIEGAEVSLASMMEAVQAVEAQREGLDTKEINLEVGNDASIDEIVDKFFPDANEEVKAAVKAMLESLKAAPATDNEPEEEAQDDDDEFAEGVVYGESLEKDPTERRKLDREHESEGMRRAMADCNIDAEDPKESHAFAEGVKYGEKLMRNKAEREKLDREHESEGMKKLLEDQKEELEEQKAAMDSKLRSMKEKTVNEMKAHYKALYAATQDCRPVLGNLVDPMAFDSADDIYRKALRVCGVDTRGVHSSAFPAMLKMARKGMTPKHDQPVAVATDSAPDESMKAAAAGLARIQH